MKKEFISLNLDPALKRKLQKVADNEHRSLSAQCVFFLAQAVLRTGTEQHGKQSAADHAGEAMAS